jgi:hypothetical protein
MVMNLTLIQLDLHHHPNQTHQPTNPKKAEYKSLAARFDGLARLLRLDALPETLKGAAGSVDLELTNLASLTSREPLVFSKGVALPQSLAPAHLGKWWRGGGKSGGREGGGEKCDEAGGLGSAGCLLHGPAEVRAALAGSVHRRCPGWWRGDAVTCRLAKGGEGAGGNVTVVTD